MKKFFDEDSLKEELDSLASTAKGDLNVLFDWYDRPDHNWQYGSQQQFLLWVCDEMGKQGTRLGYDAVRKRYQRHQSLSPEQRLLKNLRKTKQKTQKKAFFFSELFNSDYQESFTGIRLDNRVNDIFNHVQEKIKLLYDVNDGYILNRNDIAARGVWINCKMAQKLWDFIDIDTECKLTLVDLQQIIRGSGLFIVFANSQMKKTARSLGDKYKRIEKKREEIIESGILEEQEQFYVFRRNYTFSSPSLAASVLLGINVNGQVFWRDCRGRTFRELHQKFDKIKRGPGRPKKSS